MDDTIQGEDFHFVVVLSMFNPSVTSRLLTGAIDALVQAGVPEDQTTVVRVPGAFEIPVVAQRLAQSGKYHAVICLGAVIRGETPHFEYISAEVARGIGQVALECTIPVIFGVVTTDTVDQANERSVIGGRNKGFEAGVAAVEMARLWATLP
ncbi:MAG TPA: 6,7-dimethyl-8-ribityllumazine synthase [Nitrospirales bacterium]|nr:6,7-dimethyl-8-ribityllumazine synthase [Nitrospirales bacterium]HIN33160.1 6,7-dimethyl-8-ribityllumazine synthase [Nitrospirales bacterium]HIO21065.1 6,7-dimethyl-8-ribityllumazine synthase [Nitrospirales bacterium]